MRKSLILATALVVGLSSISFAKANMQKSPEGVKKLQAMAGEKGPYYRAKKEVFPKDYFLVSQNLPFLVGAALFHPNSDTLKLSKEQLEKLKEMKNTVVPVSAKMAKEVKALELKLANNVVKEGKDSKSQAELVKKIADLKTKMTLAHIDCINKVQKILSKEQFAQLIKLVSNKK